MDGSLLVVGGFVLLILHGRSTPGCWWVRVAYPSRTVHSWLLVGSCCLSFTDGPLLAVGGFVLLILHGRFTPGCWWVRVVYPSRTVHSWLLVGSCCSSFHGRLGSLLVVGGFVLLIFSRTSGFTPGCWWVRVAHLFTDDWVHSWLLVGSCCSFFHGRLGSLLVVGGFMLLIFSRTSGFTPGCWWVHVAHLFTDVWVHSWLLVGSCCSSFHGRLGSLLVVGGFMLLIFSRTSGFTPGCWWVRVAHLFTDDWVHSWLLVGSCCSSFHGRLGSLLVVGGRLVSLLVVGGLIFSAFCVFCLFVLCTQCCQFLWIVHSSFPLRFSLAFIQPHYF